MAQEVLNVLQRLVRRDDEVRNRLVEQGELYGNYAEAMQRVHIENAHELNDLIERHGWPGVKLVGANGGRLVWRIAQHANCTPHLQRRFLVELSRAVQRGDAPRQQLAYLEDRVRFNEGRPQRYGTILDWMDDGELGCEVEDRELLDDRRASVGLPDFQRSVDEARRAIESEGGGPPRDLADYRRRAHQWAVDRGWRNR